jgi:hypothetical protein
MTRVTKTMHRASRWTWLLAGLGIGYVLGTRAGRERYEQMAGWARRTSDDFGMTNALDRIKGSARDTALDLRDEAAGRTREALDNGAQSVTDRIEDVGARVHPMQS